MNCRDSLHPPQKSSEVLLGAAGTELGALGVEDVDKAELRNQITNWLHNSDSGAESVSDNGPQEKPRFREKFSSSLQVTSHLYLDKELPAKSPAPFSVQLQRHNLYFFNI